MRHLAPASDDPYALLGVAHGVDPTTLRAARRRLARDLHPDHAGGDAEAMRRINLAYEAVLADLAAGAAAPAPEPAAPTSPVRRTGGRVAHDVASFTVEALPVEAFEALFVVAGVLGEVLDDDPPYQLDVVLGDPFGCWCRLDLVPDAGASTVAVTLASIEGATLPDIDDVRDAWVRELNLLGPPEQPT